MPDILRRSLPFAGLPPVARAADEDGNDAGVRTIGITAIVFERESQPIWGMFREIIDRDVVINHPEGRDWMMWNQHRSEEVLGREINESLSFSRSDEGFHLLSRESEFDIGYWNSAYGQVRSGLVDGASFTFRPTREEWIEPESEEGQRFEDDLPRVRVREMILYEGSPVTMPAYLDTSVDRSAGVFSRSEGMQSYQEAIDRFRASTPTHSYRPLAVARKRKLWLANQGLEV